IQLLQFYATHLGLNYPNSRFRLKKEFTSFFFGFWFPMGFEVYITQWSMLDESERQEIRLTLGIVIGNGTKIEKKNIPTFIRFISIVPNEKNWELIGSIRYWCIRRTQFSCGYIRDDVNDELMNK
ncbi:hypothetical protein BLOT_010086, partial [Blomia tropicalis]